MAAVRKTLGRDSVPEEAKEKASSDPAPAAPADPKFPVTQLIESGPALLGFEPYEVAGALCNAKSDLTISDAKAKVESWLASPVKEG